MLVDFTNKSYYTYFVGVHLMTSPYVYNLAMAFQIWKRTSPIFSPINPGIANPTHQAVPPSPVVQLPTWELED